ncbi:unnamed protein product [Pichia kudriavzevii]
MESFSSQDSFEFDEVDDEQLDAVLNVTGASNHKGTRDHLPEYVEVQPHPPPPSASTISKHLNYDNLDTIVYPTNLQMRDYQYQIVQRALFENTLCAIPTGLGKTFIASTVMLNFFNWTNNLKIIFMAPTKPLVAQQIKAFLQISGISMAFTDILLDRTRRNRRQIWDSKRVLFTTPQVVENDLKFGILDPVNVALLVIDEAHRATGNYAYTNVISFMNRFNSSFRVLALTATPGSDVEAIQNVIKNLNISRIELRTENDPDIAKYIKTKTIEKLDCPKTDEIDTIVNYICEAIQPVLQKANDAGIYDITDPAKINHFMAMEKSQKIIKNPKLSEGLKWSYYFILQLLGTVGQCLRRLNIYGVNVFYNYFLEKYTEFTTKFSNKKSTNKLAASFYYHDQIIEMKKYVERLLENDLQNNSKDHIKGEFAHTKLQYTVKELTTFFQESKQSSSSCIIFTEYRESALEIVRVLENANTAIGEELLRPHIFIGQSKEKDKFDQDAYLMKILPKKKKKALEEKKNKANGKETIDGKENTLEPRDAERLGSSEMAQLKGMNQKSQKELIQNFKNGTYNILVATSIGEEGLDIGEVDLIVCFDSTQSPIKNIQRMGRTGRKRDGRVLLLFSSNERTKFESAMGKYEWIQNQIKNSSSFQYFDAEKNRIVPQNITPKVELRYITIPQENEHLLTESDIVDTDEFIKLAAQTIQKNGKPPKKRKILGKKASKDDNKQTKLDKVFFIPANAQEGFKPALSLVKQVRPGTAIKQLPALIIKPQAKPTLGPLPSSSGANESIDLTINSSDEQTNEGQTEGDKTSDISGNILPRASNQPHGVSKQGDKLNINFDDFSEDEFSDVSFSDISKNAVTLGSSLPAKRPFTDLSSDIFSDGIDDDELIRQLEKNEVGEDQPRPAKR